MFRFNHISSLLIHLFFTNFNIRQLTPSEGESDDTCKVAKCMNTCENLETFCGYNGTASGQDKLCMLRQVIDNTTENESNNPPPCSAPFTCSSNGQSITSVTDEISCLNACIACQNDNNWACTADFRTYTHTNKAINGTIKTTSFKCSCEQPNCGSGNFTNVCMDTGYNQNGAMAVGLSRLWLSVLLGIASVAWIFIF